MRRRPAPRESFSYRRLSRLFFFALLSTAHIGLSFESWLSASSSDLAELAGMMWSICHWFMLCHPISPSELAFQVPHN